MTTQANLGKIWAITGDTTDPGDTKYAKGWEAEIPTYQNFNFVLQNYDKNFLALAERGNFDWQDNIAYERGTKVLEDGTYWFCITDHTDQQPSLDTLQNYWKKGEQLGSLLETYPKGGFVLNKIQERAGDIWVGQDNTVVGNTNALVLMAAPATSHNLLFGNIKGELCVVDVGTAINPNDTTVLLPTESAVFRLYHEGHKPVQSEVAGTIPANVSDGKLYGRRNGNWEDVNNLIKRIGKYSTSSTRLVAHPTETVILTQSFTTGANGEVVLNASCRIGFDGAFTRTTVLLGIKLGDINGAWVDIGHGTSVTGSSGDYVTVPILTSSTLLPNTTYLAIVYGYNNIGTDGAWIEATSIVGWHK